MDLSFANQILSMIYLVRKRGSFEPRVYEVPDGIDQMVAKYALKAFGISVDRNVYHTPPDEW
jgi:adenosylhomocysteinase